MKLYQDRPEEDERIKRTLLGHYDSQVKPNLKPEWKYCGLPYLRFAKGLKDLKDV